jgi:nitrite reductase (NO-forming)
VTFGQSDTRSAAEMLSVLSHGPLYAGPSLDTDFHIVGTVLNTAYPFGDMNPDDALHNVQTVTVPAGGAGDFDVKIDKPGLYPFVSHAFAAVDQGQVGLLNVGNVHGTMSH